MAQINLSGLFYRSSLPTIKRFFSQYAKIFIPAGTDFVIEGGDLRSVFFLERGLASLSTSTKQGTKTIIFQTGHSLCNDIQLMSGSSQAFLRAYSHTDLQMWSMPPGDFYHLIDTEQQFFLEVARGVYLRTNLLKLQLSMLRFSDAETRIENFIGDLDEFQQIDRFKSPKKLMSHHRIAEALALHRVTVTKTLKELEKP